MSRILRTLSLPALGALLLGCPPRSTPSDSQEPTDGALASRVLMISVDTYRRDFLERYGGQTGATDFMDTLASQALVLDRHSSCSNWTLPAVLCAANGRPSDEFGYVSRVGPDHREVVPSRPSLASWLRDAGYATVLYTANGWLEGEWHHDEGYDVAVDLGTATAPKVWEAGRNALLRQIDDIHSDRWFLHIHMDDPHAPYNPPEEYLGELEGLDPIDYDLSNYEEHESARWQLPSMEPDERALVIEHMRVRYEAEMRYFDDMLEDVVDEAEEQGFLDDTLLVLWTDHGEQAYERNNWGHAYRLYEEESGAVAFFIHPEIEPASWDAPTTHIDIAPTVLSYLGVERPDIIEGLPVGEALDDRVILQITVGQLGPIFGATTGDLRMYYDFRFNAVGVFDYAADPSETQDLCDLGDPDQAALWNELDAYVDRVEPLLHEYDRGAGEVACQDFPG
jgi:arylsulfatase A-like enzyme